MQTGRRLALDVGKARIGVAVSDFHGILSSPVGACSRGASNEETLTNWSRFLAAEVENIGDEFTAIYVGLPINLKGDATASTSDAIEVGRAFAGAIGLTPRFIDERLTTVAAAVQLRASGFDARGAKGKIDAAAATLILEQALAIERNTLEPAGKSLEEAVDASSN